MPLIVEQCRSGRLPLIGRYVVELYEITRHDALVDVFMQQGTTPAFSIVEQCKLLRAKHGGFDKPLREHLKKEYQKWSSPQTCIDCCEIVKALGSAKTKEGKSLLDLIHDELVALRSPSPAGLHRQLLTTVEAALVEYSNGGMWDPSSSKTLPSERRRPGKKQIPWAERERELAVRTDFESFHESTGERRLEKYIAQSGSSIKLAELKKMFDRLRSFQSELLDKYESRVDGASTDEEFAALQCPGMPIAEMHHLIARERQRRQSKRSSEEQAE